jgi:hypothetical protein
MGGEVVTEVKLSADHIAAINRRRRVVANFDQGCTMAPFTTEGVTIDQLVSFHFGVIDFEGSQIDSVWWLWGDGNVAPYPSKVLLVFDHPKYTKWFEAGIDPVQIYLEETKRRGREAFFTYRVNAADLEGGVFRALPMKLEHPDWLIHAWEGPFGFWNFAVEGVREYKLSILCEVAEKYDFDGLDVDFGRRCPVLPPGQQWENREKLTEFMRAVRAMTLEVEERRGRPLLLSARVHENIVGCHLDGLDVETWAREQLVDMFVLGVRSFDVDIAAFRRLTAGTNIKLYPCIDDYHASDGYRWPPMEVFRGVFANWWHQGADGIEAFNFTSESPEVLDRAGLHAYASWWAGIWPTHRQAFQEMGSPETLRRKDKVFVVQRRGGGHMARIVPRPEDWHTPRWAYGDSNMFAPLPAPLANDGRADTLLEVCVADDVSADAARIDKLTLRVLLSDPAAEGVAEEDRLERVEMETSQQLLDRAMPILAEAIPEVEAVSRNDADVGTYERHLRSIPPASGVEDRIEARLNGALLTRPCVQSGWLVFELRPTQLAVGSNLVGLRVTERSPDVADEMSVEKLEVHVTYR